MTTPTPSPAPANDINSLSASLAGLDPTSTSSYFGLVKPDDTIWSNGANSLASILGLKPAADGTVKARDLLDALSAVSKSDPGVAATVQNLLNLAGSYSKVNATPVLGVIGSSDLRAFADYLNTAQSVQAGVKNNADLQQTKPTYTDPLTDLRTDALVGQQQGVQAALTKRATAVATAQANLASQTITVSHPDLDSIKATVRTAAKNVLGENVSDAELDQISNQIDVNATDGKATLAKARAESAKLDAYATETDQANQTVSDTIGATDSNGVYQGTSLGGAAPGRTGDALDRANPGVSVNLDQFLNAFTTTAPISGQPFGFVNSPSSWAVAAQGAGLGSNAPMSAANQQYVARYVANSVYQATGSWDAAAVALTSGTSAAQSYVNNPNASKWTAASAGQPSVQQRLAGLHQAFTSQQGSAVISGSTDAGAITPGTLTGPAATAADAAVGSNSSMPQEVDSQQVDPGADAEAAIRAAHPDQAGAHDIATQFDSFLSLIGAK